MAKEAQEKYAQYELSKREIRRLKRVYRCIERASKEGKTSIDAPCNLTDKMSKALEKEGFKLVGHGAWDSWWTSIHWGE